MNMTAIDILNILKLQPTGYQVELEKYAKEKNIQLPDVLCDFIDRVANNPLFETADVWTAAPILYSEVLERNEGEVPEGLEEYLLIGSDCGAGVAVFGIRMQDLDMKNPPVYLHIEGDDANDWQCMFDSVSDFLMTTLCDVLACINYHTAVDELRKCGYSCQEFHDADSIQGFLKRHGMDWDKTPKHKSIYGTDAQVGCFYDNDLNQLVIVRTDEGEMEMYVYNKFWYTFFASSYPNGYDEELDMSVEEIVGELADSDWWDEFTGYYEGVFEECDGYLDEPRTMEFELAVDQKLTIEFHPGDIVYYVNGEVLGCTGPHWKLQVIPFAELQKLEEVSGGNELFWLLLPLAKVAADEEQEVGMVLEQKLQELFPAEVCEKLAVCVMRQLV